MILQLNTKNNLIDIVKGIDNGIYREYLVENHPNNRLSRLIYSAFKIKEKYKFEPFIEVKYEYGSRNKRLEIVYKDDRTFNLCKISNFKEFDKDTLELQSVIANILDNDNFKPSEFRGIIIFFENYNDLIVNSFFSEYAPGFCAYNFTSL